MTERLTMFDPLACCPHSVDDARRYHEGTAAMLRERRTAVSIGLDLTTESLGEIRRIAYTQVEELDSLDLNTPYSKLIAIRACKILNELLDGGGEGISGVVLEEVMLDGINLGDRFGCGFLGQRANALPHDGRFDRKSELTAYFDACCEGFP